METLSAVFFSFTVLLCFCFFLQCVSECNVISVMGWIWAGFAPSVGYRKFWQNVAGGQPLGWGRDAKLLETIRTLIPISGMELECHAGDYSVFCWSCVFY